MGTFLQISSFSRHNLNNAEYTNFLMRFIKLLPLTEEEEDDRPVIESLQNDDEKELGAPALSVPAEMITRLKELIEKLVDLSRETRSHVETDELAEIDKQRDNLAAYIVNRIAKSATLPLETERKAGKLLYNTAKVYRNVGRLPVAQETVTIKGMLADLSKPEFAEAIATLGLQPYMDELKTQNDMYEQLVAQRDAARSTARTLEYSKELRKQADLLYDDITDLAFASNVLKPSTESTTFINDLNSLTATVQAARNQRSSAPVSKTEPGEGDDKPDKDDDRPIL